MSVVRTRGGAGPGPAVSVNSLHYNNDAWLHYRINGFCDASEDVVRACRSPRLLAQQKGLETGTVQYWAHHCFTVDWALQMMLVGNDIDTVLKRQVKHRS